MGIKDAIKFSNMFDIDINKLDRKQGKYYSDDFEIVKDYYYKNLTEEEQAYRDNVNKRKRFNVSTGRSGLIINWDQLIDIYKKDADALNKLSEEWYDHIKEQSGLEKGELISMIDEYISQGSDSSFLDWAHEYYSELSVNFDEAINSAAAAQLFEGKN